MNCFLFFCHFQPQVGLLANVTLGKHTFKLLPKEFYDLNLAAGTRYSSNFLKSIHIYACLSHDFMCRYKHVLVTGVSTCLASICSEARRGGLFGLRDAFGCKVDPPQEIDSTDDGEFFNRQAGKLTEAAFPGITNAFKTHNSTSGTSRYVAERAKERTADYMEQIRLANQVAAKDNPLAHDLAHDDDDGHDFDPTEEDLLKACAESENGDNPPKRIMKTLEAAVPVLEKPSRKRKPCVSQSKGGKKLAREPKKGARPMVSGEIIEFFFFSQCWFSMYGLLLLISDRPQNHPPMIT